MGGYSPLNVLCTPPLPGRMTVGSGWVRQEGAIMTVSAVPGSALATSSAVFTSPESQVQYESPRLDEMGSVVELTRGTETDDTADMKATKYW